MKINKLFFILIFFSFLFLNINNVSAISGTCSSHGGVSCSAGTDYDGSAICNDGWRDSSELFSEQLMCKKESSCRYPVYSSCDVDYAKQQAQQRSQNRSFSVGRSGGNGQLLDWTQDANYLSCKNTQALYEAGQNGYNQCISEENNRIKKENDRLDAYIKLKFNQACVQNNGSGSVWDDSFPDKCTPVKKEKTEQVDLLKQCQDRLGINSFSDNEGLCYCSDGYIFDMLKKTCTEKLIPLNEKITTKEFIFKNSIKTESKSKSIGAPLERENKVTNNKNINSIKDKPQTEKVRWYQRIFNWFKRK